MFADVKGTTIFYEITGEGLPLVFVHGLGGTGNIWYAQRGVLGQYFKVITLDLPGSGRSDRSERHYTMEKWCEQIAALADHLKLDKFVLIGHSMTTVLAQKFAGKHGNRLSGLVLCGPFTELPPAGKEAFVKRADTVQKEGMLAVVDHVLAAALRPAREAHPSLVGLVREMLLSHDPACYAGHCLALVNASAKADQTNIKCPTLLLVGDQDGVTPLGNCRAIAAAIPGAKVRVIPGTAHLTMIERPELFNVALIEFLATL